MQFVKSYLIKILGAPDSFSLQHRITNAVCLFATFTATISAIINHILGITFYVNVGVGMVMIISAYLYYLSRFHGRYTSVFYPLLIELLLIIIYGWFLKDGSNGSITFLYFLAVISMASIADKKQKIVMLCAVLFSFITMVLIEYDFPELIINYNDKTTRFFDFTFFFILVIGLTFLFTQTLMNNYKKEQNITEIERNKVLKMNIQLQQQNEEIIQQQTILSNRNRLIELQNDKIVGSIQAAKLIQEALLPSKNILDKYFESYIIYKPKDIVSGDFYWFSEIEKHRSRYIFVVVADCTGHGVSGAFMSMIGNITLNEIINEKKIVDPKEILLYVSQRIETALKQKSSENLDGIDMCLCRFEVMRNGFELVYSGAKIPLFIFKKSEKTIRKIKADRKSCGGAFGVYTNGNFTKHEIKLESGDMVYMFSDGISDQVNIERKRFSVNRLTQKLGEIAELSAYAQSKILDETLLEWQDTEDQLDDITFIGLKI